MKYFKYTSLILVTIWVVFYSESKAENYNYALATNKLYNQSRIDYFAINAKIIKNNKDIEFYRSRKLNLMSKQDFNSKSYQEYSSIIQNRTRENETLLLKKNSLQYKNFKIKPEEYFIQK